MDPVLTSMLARLAEVTARNTTAAVYDRVKAVKAGKANQETVNQLTEIINDLVEDKNDLVRISKALEEELVAERVSDEDIEYITESIIPTIENLVKVSNEGDDEEAADSDIAKTLELVKSLVSKETLTVLQLIGFSFREGIGEPLTTICRRAILSVVGDSASSAELALVEARSNLAGLEIAKNDAAYKRFDRMLRRNPPH